MSNAVEIVIRAVDEFSPSFQSLDAALQRTQGAGRQAQGALADVGGSFAQLAEASGSADAALAQFVTGAETRLSELDAQRLAALEAMAAEHEAAAQDLNERLLAIDETATAQREAQQQGAQERERAARQAHYTGLLDQEARVQKQLADLELTTARMRLTIFKELLESLSALAGSHGAALARGAQALAIAEALIAAYLAGNKALGSVPFPYNLAAAAAVTAQGLATVERIRRVSIAHGGLELVPQEATFLLQRGERVLSAPQNRDLTRFLEGAPRPDERPAGGAGVTVQTLQINVLPNATNADALLRMDRNELRRVVSDRIIPMLDELARRGVRPNFTEANV